MMKNYYEILNIERTATGRDIRNAYLKRVKEVHPDSKNFSFKESNDVLSEINEAYSVLKDPKRRAAYEATFKETKKSVFYDSAEAAYYPNSFGQELKDEKTYKRVMIVLWVVMGFVLSLLVTTLFSVNKTLDEQSPTPDSFFPGELQPKGEQRTPNQGQNPKEILIIREI